MPSLNHPFAALEREGSIERVGPDAGEVARLHAVVDRDRATAEYLRTRDHDWTLAIVYNGMLQGCQALMAAYGYRSRGDHQHRTSIEFVRIALPGHVTLLDRLDRIRSERNRTVYDVAGQTTQEEMEDALTLAAGLTPILKAAALKELQGLTHGPLA